MPLLYWTRYDEATDQQQDYTIQYKFTGHNSNGSREQPPSYIELEWEIEPEMEPTLEEDTMITAACNRGDKSLFTVVEREGSLC